MNIFRHFPIRLLLVLLASATFLTSCKDEDDKKNPEPQAPSTYNFEGVDYSQQTALLDMMAALGTEMRKANTPNTAVEAQLMLNMYRNQNSPFASADLNGRTFNLKQFTNSAWADTIEVWINNVAAASQSTAPGAAGTAGVLTNPNNPNQRYSVDANGVEWIQLVEKGLMGALLYYQGVNVLLDDSRIGGSASINDRQRNWDASFGLYGVPVDFPTNTNGLRFHGRYGNDRNALLSTNQIMNHFISGRFNIDRDNRGGINAARQGVRTEWERIIAGTAVKYLNDAKRSFGVDAVRCHVLSEAIAFVFMLKFNPDKRISDAQITQAMNLIGWDYWNITTTRIDQVIDILSSVYAFGDATPQLKQAAFEEELPF